MAVPVKELIAKPFCNRNFEQKLQIIQSGKPRPFINETVSFNMKKTSIQDLYDDEIWVTACEENRTLHCWTCLLFSMSDFSDTSKTIARTRDAGLYKRIIEHGNSTSHISGFFQYRLFVKKNLQSTANPGNKELVLNDRRNREVLNRIIDAVLLSVDQVSPPYAADDFYPCEFEKHVELLLKSLKKYEITNITDEAIDFVRRYPKILTETMEAMASVMQRAIMQETESCAHVSLILSEHSKCKGTSTVSSVFRYVYKGNVCERFINFKNFTINLINAEDIKTYISELIQEFKMSSKVFSLSVDGAVLPREDLFKLSVLFNQPAYRFFPPCHFHNFNCVLEQSLSNFELCEFFFDVLNSMRSFFMDSSKNCDEFNAFTNGKIVDLKIFKLDNSQFLRILKTHRRTFIAFFSEIAGNYEKGDGNDVSKANGFGDILQDYRIVFLIETFYLLFDIVAVLTEMLSSCSPENAFDLVILHDIKIKLMKERVEGFGRLWTFVKSEFAADGKQDVIEAVTEDEESELLALFVNIVDCIKDEINIRFGCAFKLDFLSFLNCEPHSKLVISDQQKKKMGNLTVTPLKGCQMIKELKVLSKKGAIFGGMSVYGIMDILKKWNLSDTFPNVYRLAEIIVTLPCKPIPHKNNNESKIHTISSWASAYRPENQFLSLLCIEKGYLEYLSSRYDFHDDVILKLQELSIYNLNYV